MLPTIRKYLTWAAVVVVLIIMVFMGVKYYQSVRSDSLATECVQYPSRYAQAVCDSVKGRDALQHSGQAGPKQNDPKTPPAPVVPVRPRRPGF